MGAIKMLRDLRASRPDLQPRLQWLADGQHMKGCDCDDVGFDPCPVLTVEMWGKTLVKKLDGMK